MEQVKPQLAASQRWISCLVYMKLDRGDSSCCKWRRCLTDILTRSGITFLCQRRLSVALNCLPGVFTLESCSIWKSGSSLSVTSSSDVSVSSVTCCTHLCPFRAVLSRAGLFYIVTNMQNDFASRKRDIFGHTLHSSSFLCFLWSIHHVCWNSSSRPSFPLRPLYLPFFRVIIICLFVARSVDLLVRWGLILFHGIELFGCGLIRPVDIKCLIQVQFLFFE